MARIEWGQVGKRFYDTGVDRGVLYPRQTSGVPWNGLVSVTEGSSGGDVEPLYFDGIKYLDFVAAEDFEGIIEAYSSPEEFAGCDGTKVLSPGLLVTQQPRYPFGFSWRQYLANDVEGVDYGYKIHLVYNATASPVSRVHRTISTSADVSTRSWTIHTVPPVGATTYKPTSHFIIDSTKITTSKLTAIENMLYGSSSQAPELPSQATVIATLS